MAKKDAHLKWLWETSRACQSHIAGDQTKAENFHARATRDGFTDAEITQYIAKARRNARARANRKARDQVMRDCGLVKVRGALGGTYWE
jgi:hypothetical protein